MSNTQIVQDFIAKWEAKDVEGILSSFTDNPFYHNIPMEPLTSVDAIRQFVEPFIKDVTRVEWDVRFIAEDAQGNVLTERVDTFHFGDKKISLPVMGTFELEGGKVARWRDYFDLREFEKQMAELQG